MPSPGHTYLKTHRVSAPVLRFALRKEAAALEETAAYRRSGRTATTLVKEGGLSVEVVALRNGTSMARHRAKAHVTIHVLRGALRITTAEGPTDVGPGDLLVLAANMPHTVIARRDAGFLLTLALQR